MLFLAPLQFVHLFHNVSQVYPAVLLMYFISAAVILLASIALIVQVSLPYNKTRRTRFYLFFGNLMTFSVASVKRDNLTGRSMNNEFERM